MIPFGISMVAPAALAWGDSGHQAVGEIAWQALGTNTRLAVRDLLRADGPEGDDGGDRYRRLYSAATWADRYARAHDHDWGWLRPFHYVDADVHADHFVRDAEQCPSGGPTRPDACVVAAIDYYLARLANRDLVERERVLALRLVAHFVGDVHQPLHVAHADDIGGNKTKVKLADGRVMKIHQVWDTTLIELRLDQRGQDDREAHAPGDGWQSWAYDLHTQVTPADRTAWTADLRPDAWADESLAIAKGPAFAVANGKALPAGYAEAWTPTVEEQIQKAGVRLAAVLERALGG